MGHLLLPVNCSDLVKRLDAGREAAMDTENAPVNDGWQAEVVKDFCAIAPHCDAAIFSKTLIVEPIDLCDLSRFVVAPDQCYPVWISDLKWRKMQALAQLIWFLTYFEGEKEQKSLHWIESSVDEIPHEQVVCVWNITADLEEFL